MAVIVEVKKYKDSSWVGKEENPHELMSRDPYENVAQRRAILEWSHKEPENQQTIRVACMRDMFFFSDALVWVNDVKRHPDAPDRPFITWEFQREVMADLDASIGRKSVGVIKSRDLGGSTMPLIVFDRRLLFIYGQTLMAMSRSERWVDDPRNPDSLFWKLDYFHQWMPTWLTRNLSRTSMTYEHKAIKSNIIGSSTTGDAGRGGRKQAVLIDEYAAFDRKESFAVLASLQHNTRCRIYNSTPNGVGNGFHQVITAGNITVHRLHWSQHPVHGAGLYTSRNGQLEIIDKEFWKDITANELLEKYPESEKICPRGHHLARETYEFRLDGKTRAPYFDYEELLCPIPKLLAQELEMDFIGSGSPFFELEELRDYVRLFGRKPNMLGELTYDEHDIDNVEFAESASGRLELWFRPDIHGGPIKDRTYTIGCDISAGTGASNSTVSVGDTQLRSKVAGLATAHMRPERFAEYVYAIGKWFNFPKIAFEGGGCGSDFGARLKELHYPNLYYMVKTSGTRAEKPGWFPNGDMKRNLLTEYGRALTMREFTNPDEVSVNECQMYEFTEGGQVAHVGSVAAADPSGAKKNHGDRVIGDALNWMLMKRTKRPESPEIEHYNRMALRQQEEEIAEAREGGWSPVDAPEPWALVRR